ncbi:MAG: response regulator [bacterium]
MHLLFIDYDWNNLRVMQNVFELWGYTVTICSNKTQVGQIHDRESFDAIITELHIPGENPAELISLMRRRWTKTPIIVLTENHSVKFAIQAMKDGANDVLQKPMEPEQLRGFLAGMMGPLRGEGMSAS